MALRFGKKSDPTPADPTPSGAAPAPPGTPPTAPSTGEASPSADPLSNFDPTDFVVQNTAYDASSPPPSESDFNFGDFAQFAQDEQNIVPPAPTYQPSPPEAPSAPPTHPSTPSEEVSLIPPSAFKAPLGEPEETVLTPPKRKLPVLPLALATILIVGGGIGALFLMKNQGDNATEDENNPTTIAARPTRATRPSATVASNTVVAPTAVPQVAPTKVASTKTTQSAPMGQTSRTPLASATVPKTGTSSQSAPRSTDLKSLKSLWDQGANAKHKGDIEGARRAWTQILALSPNHPGISDALAKLSSPSGTRRIPANSTMKR